MQIFAKAFFKGFGSRFQVIGVLLAEGVEVQAVQQVGQVRVLRRSGIPLYGAALRPDAVDARQADYSRCALAIGSEGRGLSREVLDLCDKTVLIPMSPRCESLNAAIAAAVLLWESWR